MTANGGLKPLGLVALRMQCHYCEDDAAVAVEKDHVKVGLCEVHLRERMEELSDTEWLEEVRSEIDEALDN